MSEGQGKRGTANRGNKQESLQREKNESIKDISKSYNEFKEFEGKKYTGMRVGGHHRWYYDKGEWEEKKIAPDKWEFTYAVTKRRAGHAPEGSGVPVGTEYHWYMLPHQMLTIIQLPWQVSNTNWRISAPRKENGTYQMIHKRSD
jgi:hypothetical protein